MERKSFEQTLNDIDQPNDLELYKTAFNFNAQRWPEEHRKVIDSADYYFEEREVLYAQYIVDRWVWGCIKADGTRMGSEQEEWPQ